MKSLILFWVEGKCPILNGVIFADGRYDCVEPQSLPRSRGVTCLVVKSRSSLKEYAPFSFTRLIPTCRYEALDKNIIIVGGECGMGEDGFVAVTDAGGQISWIAYFDFSNPFVKVDLLSEGIIAENNLGETWHFELKDPSNIRIVIPIK